MAAAAPSHSMASLTIIPYTPKPANSYHSNNRSRAKDIFKRANDHDKGPQTKSGILPVDVPQPQALATHGKDSNSVDGSEEVGIVENGDLEIEFDSLFDEILNVAEPKNNNLVTEIDTFTEPDAESKVGGTKVQDGGAEFEINDIESGMGGLETIHRPLKRKAGSGGQGSQDNPRVILDSDTESEDETVWKKRKVDHSLVGHGVRSWRRTIDETDESDNTEFEIDGTRVRVGDAQSENDGVTSETSGGESNEQSRPQSAVPSAHLSNILSTSSKSTDLVEPQSVARVGDNGEWGIHGIIGKEVIDGEVYYCVDWEPTMMPLDQLWGAQRLVREFEAKEQARIRRAGNTRQKRRGRPRKQI